MSVVTLSSKAGSCAATEIGVEREGCAVEHQFVLAADLVEIDQRQAALGDARDRDRQAQVVLVARIGRAVRHDEDFRAGLGEALDDVLVLLGLFSQMSSQIGTPTRTPRRSRDPRPARARTGAFRRTRRNSAGWP